MTCTECNFHLEIQMYELGDTVENIQVEINEGASKNTVVGFSQCSPAKAKALMLKNAIIFFQKQAADISGMVQ